MSVLLQQARCAIHWLGGLLKEIVEPLSRLVFLFGPSLQSPPFESGNHLRLESGLVRPRGGAQVPFLNGRLSISF